MINQELYQKLLDCNWFKNCGTDRDISYNFEVRLTSDSKKMIKGIQSIVGKI